MFLTAQLNAPLQGSSPPEFSFYTKSPSAIAPIPLIFPFRFFSFSHTSELNHYGRFAHVALRSFIAFLQEHQANYIN